MLAAFSSHAGKSKSCAKASSRLLLPLVQHKSSGIAGGERAIPTLFRYAAPARKEPGKKMINLAHHYRLWFERQNTSLHLIVPALPGKRGLADYSTLEKVQRVLQKIPLKALPSVKTIVVNPRRYRFQERLLRGMEDLPDDYQLIIPAVTEIDSQKRAHIHLFPSWTSQPYAFQLNDFRHELGHAVAVKNYGSSWPGPNWVLAATRDNLTISDYGSTSIDEDFAEAVALYLETEAGTKAPKVRRNYSHRFEILDKIFGIKR